MSAAALTSQATIEVEVRWLTGEAAGPAVVCCERLSLPHGVRVADALAALDRPDLRGELDAGNLSVAIYGEAASLLSPLHAGDRIELLAPLVADPKQSRARRAEVQRRRQGDARWQRR